MDQKNIRNFSIIAHIDHGKSTLADRMLEVTNTIEKRKMREQVLDAMELERERGITIKMTPVRMQYTHEGEQYTLNLIDTPGHIDFAYEVSRALKAVEGVVLLVDSTQGVQAQTLTTLGMAREMGLVVLPVVSKVDAPLARAKEVREELARLLGVPSQTVLETSGKTGQGVLELLREIIMRIAPPQQSLEALRALVFDFQYSNHQGVIVYVRLFAGSISKADRLAFCVADATFAANEIGVFSPDMRPVNSLQAGEIGYIVTGIKKPGIASVGDTITSAALAGKRGALALAGYQTPKPVVWATLYPESQDDFGALRQALERLRLSDSSLSFEEEYSESLGRGFRAGFLGMLHMEIVIERLKREFSLALVVTTPSITYEVTMGNGKRETVYTPGMFPDDGVAASVQEPWMVVRIITPPEYLGSIVTLMHQHEAVVGNTEAFSDRRVQISVEMPLRELMRGFFDEIKSVSSGFASLSYEFEDMRRADVVRLDVLIAEEKMPALTRVVSRRRVQEEAEHIVEKLHELLPKQLFVTKIQAKAFGRILSSRTLSALRKDVTAKLYGGDVTRKMKLLEKQKKGKKKMLARGKVDIPQEVFLKVVRG